MLTHGEWKVRKRPGGRWERWSAGSLLWVPWFPIQMIPMENRSKRNLTGRHDLEMLGQTAENSGSTPEGSKLSVVLGPIFPIGKSSITCIFFLAQKIAAAMGGWGWFTITTQENSVINGRNQGLPSSVLFASGNSCSKSGRKHFHVSCGVGL